MKKTIARLFIFGLGIFLGLIIGVSYLLENSFSIGKTSRYNITEELTYNDIKTEFYHWSADNDKEANKLILFLRKNDLVILPEQYSFNPGARFEDVLFVFKFGVNSKSDNYTTN